MKIFRYLLTNRINKTDIDGIKTKVLGFPNTGWVNEIPPPLVSPNIQFSSVAESYSTLCNPTNGSWPGSSIHDIIQARLLEWIAMPSSTGSSWSMGQTHVSCTSELAGGFFTTGATWEAPYNTYTCIYVSFGNFFLSAEWEIPPNTEFLMNCAPHIRRSEWGPAQVCTHIETHM